RILSSKRRSLAPEMVNTLMFVAANLDLFDLDRLISYHIDLAASALDMSVEETCDRFALVRVPIDVGSQSSLTSRLLEDKDAMEKLRAIANAACDPVLDFWVLGCDEVRLAGILGLPHVGSCDAANIVDSKSAARHIFREAKIRHPVGIEGLRSWEDVHIALRRLCDRCSAASFFIKLNFEEAGNGIATVERRHVGSPYREFCDAVSISKNIPFAEFTEQLELFGCVVEERVGDGLSECPSVKMFIDHQGKVKNIASHDQLMNDTVYTGSVFPARGAYRSSVIEAGYAIGEVIASKGIQGLFSVDFIAFNDGVEGSWNLWALEINVRKGATTHPYGWTRFLTGANYDPESGELIAESSPVVYISSEYIYSEGLRSLSVKDILDKIGSSGLLYSRESKNGILVHMASCMQDHGKIGVTAIAREHQSAQNMLDRLRDILRD
ncbi:MAG: peptide ligase PGM1-related protein, partial [Pseudomonadota bacterium]